MTKIEAPRVLVTWIARHDTGQTCSACGEVFEVGQFVSKLSNRTLIHKACR